MAGGIRCAFISTHDLQQTDCQYRAWALPQESFSLGNQSFGAADIPDDKSLGSVCGQTPYCAQRATVPAFSVPTAQCSQAAEPEKGGGQGMFQHCNTSRRREETKNRCWRGCHEAVGESPGIASGKVYGKFSYPRQRPRRHRED